MGDPIADREMKHTPIHQDGKTYVVFYVAEVLSLRLLLLFLLCIKNNIYQYGLAVSVDSIRYIFKRFIVNRDIACELNFEQYCIVDNKF